MTSVVSNMNVKVNITLISTTDYELVFFVTFFCFIFTSFVINDSRVSLA